MSLLAKAEATTILLALESTLGTAPSSGWVQVQPNPGGIQGWNPEFVTVERDPLSKYASREKGDNVGLNASVKLVHDLNKDWMDIHAASVWRSAAKHAGNKGMSFFRPTAVVDGGASPDEYTVAALGDLTAGLLIYARGFTNAANNGLKLVVATSSATAIKVATATLVAEASPPTNATVEIAGVQCASGDAVLTAGGNITTTTLDCTTLGLNVGQWIKIGGTSAAAMAFATASQNGYARITAIAATQLTLERHSFTPAGDTGTSKTIQLFFSRWYRNVSLDHADYLEPSLHGEMEELGVGSAGVAMYTYAKGLSTHTFELDAPLESKLVTTLSYVGTDVGDPVAAGSRAAGASSAYAPQAAALIDTSTDLRRVRLASSSTHVSLSAEVNSWKFTINNNTKPRKQQGTFGAAGMIYGKHEPSVTMEAYYLNSDIAVAARDNRDCEWDAFVVNDQVGLMFDMPAVKLRGASRAYAANEAVMVSLSVPANRDPLTNIVSSLSVFAYVPFA